MSRPVFVIPHFSETEQAWAFLSRTVASLFDQDDPDWEAIIVDDGSPSPGTGTRLAQVRGRDPSRLHVIRLSENEGPGGARNVGVEWAVGRGTPFILFLDADDVADRARLRATRQCFDARPEVHFIYSTFDVIDERDQLVATERLTPSIREILNGHACAPVEGLDPWLKVALDKGYTTPTSTVAVRAPLAAAHAFPTTYVSEDAHTWLRMLAAGTTVAFINAALCHRRICSYVKGSTTRQRFGDNFYWMKLHVDLDGFTRALEIARLRGTIHEEDDLALRHRFHLRQARTMAGEQKAVAAMVCRGLASSSSNPRHLDVPLAHAEMELPLGEPQCAP